MNVAYQGPLLDYSGYGEANRHFVAALEAAGVTVNGQLLSYSKERADYGTMGPLVKRVLENRDFYKIKILHTTPDEFERLHEPGKYEIAHFFWETDKIPQVFADGLNLVNEIWTGSEANREAIIRGGVDKPIHVIPQPIETEREWPEPYQLPDFDGYLFYSIFEWTDRKNPEALIRAFYNEFSHGENVGLLIKTYFKNFNLANKRMIRNAIENIKSSMPGGDYPPVFIYLDLMDRQQIMRLHTTGDCYVSAHRGEGWGVPQVEAALAGHPIISTGYGGVHEYFGETQGIMLPFKMVPLKGMDHSTHFYSPDQKWAEVDPEALQKALRWAYDKPIESLDMGAAGQQLVKDQFNLERVGGLMLDRLTEIEATL